MTRAVAIAVAVLLVGSCSGSSGDTSAFCARFDALTADDPFDDLDVVRPAEMETAFVALRSAADGLAEVAPPEASADAGAYVRAIGALMDLLAGVGYDPRGLDTLEYNAAVADYAAVAERLGRAADVLCPVP